MGSGFSKKSSKSAKRQKKYRRNTVRKSKSNMKRNFDRNDDNYLEEGVGHVMIQGPPLAHFINMCPQPPYIKNMESMPTNTCIFMIKPFKYNQSNPNDEPVPISNENQYIDYWDASHVRMPCSPSYTFRNGQPRWPMISQQLLELKRKCDHRIATVGNLKRTIETCLGYHINMDCLEHLINEIYSNHERLYFMSTVLSNICSLALNVDILCSQPPTLLRIGSNRSITMSQRQAASLLACAFFCLFPYRSNTKGRKEYQNFQNPNFNTLYQRGHMQKVEKLRCILHYFDRITQNMPNGVITFRRYALPHQFIPKWLESRNGLAPMHLTTAHKIEDVDCVLQVDFANKYIGGGVLTAGCVQEEIRFVMCPEMLVSLLVCEMMQDNECIYLIGCERYSSYKGYGTKFQYAGNYIDRNPKDNWGRKWCHLVAIDAICFQDPSVQYHMKLIKRELIKAYTGFHTRGQTSNDLFPIATGNWGCGAFNGDRQLKAIIQLLAASEATRPLVYSAYGDKTLIESFSIVYDYLISQRATASDLYRYLQQYSHRRINVPLFDFILKTPISLLGS